MKNLKQILVESQIPFKNDRISIPAWVKHIKLDVGLSYNSPMARQWVMTEEDLLVFGFEPDPTSIASILDKENKQRLPGHGIPLEYKYLNDRVFLVPVALGSVNSEIDFYVTPGGGCSSVYQPKESFRTVDQIVKVPIFKLKEFFDLIPWADGNSSLAADNRTVEFIEYIKIDAQGHDLEIVKGIEDYISKVVFITLEPESSTYHHCEGNTLANIVGYMSSRGFSFVKHANTQDPTFVNNRYLHLVDKIYIYQHG